MKTKLLIIAALFAFILTGCAMDNLEIESRPEPEPKIVTVSVTISSPDDYVIPKSGADTRVSLTPNSETPHGLILQWETTDKLMLCFEYNDGTTTHYYHVDAAIDPTSISANRKSADFIVAIPGAIPFGENFNFYVVYQKTNSDSADGGCFRPNTKIYDLEMHESICLTLDKPISNQRGISRPMLYFSKTNITNTDDPAIGPISLTHAGWIIALHFKNNTSAVIDLPVFINLSSVYFDCVFNGDNPISTTSFDFSSQTFFSSSTELKDIFLSINKAGNPLYGDRLEAEASTILYRWVATNPTIPMLLGGISFSGNGVEVITRVLLRSKTVTYGKVTHIYTTWDGTSFEFSSRY